MLNDDEVRKRKLSVEAPKQGVGRLARHDHAVDEARRKRIYQDS